MAKSLHIMVPARTLLLHTWSIQYSASFIDVLFIQIEGEIARIHGEAGPAILTVANEKHADYIVIGCRGKGSVRRTFTGSVTDYVSHHAHVPVMIARHKDHLKHHHGFHLHNPFHHKKHSEKSHT